MTQEIQIVRGASKRLKIDITDEDGNKYTLRDDRERLLFGVKRTPKDEEYVIFKQITQAAEDGYMLDLIPSDTMGLEYGRYVYDVGLEKEQDYYPIIRVSPFVISPNVTKWGDVP